ncbi:MAG: HlyD family efflux transporter periplasmic adaptor subunit [Planctomyces sp.]|nr:HlyD family efflux transporter periplasmic adaptor subunit [Planctomyces sp.]
MASTGTEVLTWKLRSDIAVHAHEDGWILRDPISRVHMLMRPQEMCVVEQLRGTSTLTGILQRLQQEFPEQNWEPADVLNLLEQLRQNRMIISTNPPSAVLPPAHQQQRSRRSGLLTMIATLLTMVRALLSIRIPLMNPTRFIAAIHPVTSRLLSPWSLTIAVVICIAGFSAVLTRFDEYTREFNSLSAIVHSDTLPWLIVCLVFAKMMHETAHAVVAGHYGVATPEIGVQLILGFPLPYTDVTDAWTASRRIRMMITSAGIGMELIIAGIAGTLWSLANPGITRLILANLFAICSVGTILFNANPLLRYDGYYLLSDAIRFPNLMQQSGTLLRRAAGHLLLLGGESRREVMHTSNFQPVFYIGLLSYALMSMVYRCLVTISIMIFIGHLFDQLHLQMAGRLVNLIIAASQFAIPAASTLLIYAAQISEAKHKRSSVLRAAVFGGLILALLFVPFPRKVLSVGRVESSGIAIYTTLSGQLEDAVPYGTSVNAGEVLCQFENDDVELERLRLTSRRDELQILVKSMQVRGKVTAESGYAETAASLTAAEERLRRFEQESSRLSVTSPGRGILLPPRSRWVVAAGATTSTRLASRGTPSNVGLPKWDGTPLQSINRGAHIEAGTLLGYVGDATDIFAEFEIDPAQISRIRVGQHAEFQPIGAAGRQYRGIISQIDRLERSTAGNGESGTGWRVKMEISIAEGETPPLLYSEGRIRIWTEPEAAIRRLTDYLKVTFR